MRLSAEGSVIIAAVLRENLWLRKACSVGHVHAHQRLSTFLKAVCVCVCVCSFVRFVGNKHFTGYRAPYLT